MTIGTGLIMAKAYSCIWKSIIIGSILVWASVSLGSIAAFLLGRYVFRKCT